MEKYPKEFVELCRSVTARRPRTVIEHILEHGYITTEELKDQYGYDHPPRAARDVREHGIPLETFRVEASNGRKIGAYRFGDPAKVRIKRFAGRTALSRELKKQLIDKYVCQCFIYLEEMDERLLQIDHRIPYEVAGDDQNANLNPDDFMLLCGSANRAKSWSCEHCENWKKFKEPSTCLSCYWAYPDDYSHIAMKQIRRLDLIWEGDATKQYDSLRNDAATGGVSMPDFVKEIIAKHLDKKS